MMVMQWGVILGSRSAAASTHDYDLENSPQKVLKLHTCVYTCSTHQVPHYYLMKIKFKISWPHASSQLCAAKKSSDISPQKFSDYIIKIEWAIKTLLF